MFDKLWFCMFCLVWCGVFGYVSHFNLDFDAVKSNWVNNNKVYLGIDKVDPSMNETCFLYIHSF